MKNNYLESCYNFNFPQVFYNIKNISNIIHNASDLRILIVYLEHGRHSSGIYGRWSDMAWFDHWLQKFRGMLKIERRKTTIWNTRRL